MIKPDWNKFKAKFSENPQSNFEWFCYLLFCQEFNKSFGIFRYKNQSGIETNPIIKDSEVIGWQAKFYETTLSYHKDDLIETITKSKRDYPNLTKVIFYTNQEWGQGKSQNDPQAKIEVEQKAKESQIEIEWRTASFFETSFVAIDNKTISQHFFNLDKSIITLLEEKQAHTESILYEIQTHIDFNTQKIEIDRRNILQKIQEELNQKQILILSGVGGVGKTAVIKNFHKEIKDKVPFYIFKANEFNTNNINDLFKNFNLQGFIEAHKDEENKIIVIDSAEKLLDLQNTDPFKECLSTLIKSNWKIILTTRNNYLEDLNYQFIEIYQIIPYNLDIQNLDLKELTELSQTYNFKLPEDQKLLELIKNPFYLNEYLKFYKKEEKIDYLSFKEKLWNKIIKKSKPDREQCFLQIAFQRANVGQFFVTPNCNQTTLKSLTDDGVLGYEIAGYFITHDIYEEWALEKIIESEFLKKENNREFLKKIGESLAIRRSFRNWVSEKLLLGDDSIKQFIEEIIDDEVIESFWKDESLVSVLLSDYSEKFFELFKEKLLENNQELLKRITFLLRIACKEVDDDFFKQLGVKDINLFSIKYVLTKPKGKGWQSLIKFVYENSDKIGIENIHFILPIIHDWNNKFKKEETTKFSSLIALQYYQWIIKKDIYFSRDDDVKEKLFQTILYGASEIKEELITIFNEILKNKWKNHRDNYYDLVKVILTKFGENIEIIKALPEYILKIADLFWFQTPKIEDFYSHSRMEIEEYFCIEENHLEYFPSSAYQTPIYWLLQFSLKNTIDFILDFTNKTVECYAKSDLDKNEVKEVEVIIDDHSSIKQYISNRLWNTYRGTQVSTNLLASIHMALEKLFLERGKDADSKTLENWLLYLLKNSKSASVSAVVTSIVLAYPEKTFNVAKILFQTKDFFLYDTARFTLDLQQKSSLLMLRDSFGSNYKNKIYEEERLKACDDEHRKISLEHVAVNYQFFRNEKVSDEEAEKRQQVIWSIFDKYYHELPDKSKETEEIIDNLEKTKDKIFYLFNYSIPADACSVLVRDYFEKLSKKEKTFCKDIILEVAASSFRANYQYQIRDGVESAISVLPILLKDFPEEKEVIKTILLLTLFDPHPLGMYGRFSDYSSKAILYNLWGISFDDAQSLLLGYLLLKPKYEELSKKLLEGNYKRNIYEFHENELIKSFLTENEADLQNIIKNKISIDDLKDIEQLDLYILNTAFRLIPLKTDNKEHKKLAQSIISTFTRDLLSNKREDRVDYMVRHAFLEKLAYLVLSSSEQDIHDYLKPFIDNFNSSEAIADLFQEFIFAEDRLNTYDNFWQVWNLFYKKVVDLCKDGDKHWRIEKIIKSYLFAQTPWNETTTDWHTLKDNNKRFFGEIVKSIGHCSSVLYSISKLLNGIGSKYLNYGISWISEILNDNKNLWADKLETNTIYYLENLVKKYIYKNREKIRKMKKLKQDVLVILDFLIEKGSVVGYMLRENIL